MSLPQTQNPGVIDMPTMPQPILRPSEDHVRVSEDTDNKRPLRASQQSGRTIVPPPSSALERVSYEKPNQGSPSPAGISQWPVPRNEPASTPTPSSENKQAAPTFARSTSNDYTVYGGVESVKGNNDPYTINPYQTNEPYRRTAVQQSIERPSSMFSRHNSMTPAPSRGKMAGKPHWPDGYDPTLNEFDEEPTPQKKMSKKAPSIYLVRAGDGGSMDGSPPRDVELRLPFTSFMDGTVKGHFIAVLGEFVGTTLFLFFAFAGTIVANVGAQESITTNTTTNATVGFSPIVNLYVAVSFGFSLMVNVWIFFRVSGGLFNPAVTLGMVLTKAIGKVRAFLLLGAQICGAIFASFLVQVLFPSDFNVRTTLADRTSLAQGVFIEAILTAELVFTVFMLAKEKHKATYMAPVGIGLALFVAELVGVFFTGGSLNPARSLGPCVTTGQFDSDHWVYWVGPAIGAVAAFVFYRFIKILEYEMANPGQDDTSEDQVGSKEGRGEV